MVGEAHEHLTARQREAARLLMQGVPIQGIAETLVLSVETVRGHVRGLHARTGTHNLVALMRWINVHARCCVGSG